MFNKLFLSALASIILTIIPSFATQTFGSSQNDSTLISQEKGILVLDLLVKNQPGLYKDIHQVNKFFSEQIANHDASFYGVTLKFQGEEWFDFIREFDIERYVNVKHIIFSDLNVEREYMSEDSEDSENPILDESISAFMGNLFDKLSNHRNLDVTLKIRDAEPEYLAKLYRLNSIRSLNIKVDGISPDKFSFGDQIESITIDGGDPTGDLSIVGIGSNIKHFTILDGEPFAFGSGIDLSMAINLESLNITHLDCPVIIPQTSFKSLSLKYLFSGDLFSIINDSKTDHLEVSFDINELENADMALSRLNQICLKDLTLIGLMDYEDFDDYTQLRSFNTIGNHNLNSYFTADVINAVITPLFTEESSPDEHLLFFTTHDVLIPKFSKEDFLRAYLRQIVIDGHERRFLIYQTNASIITAIPVRQDFYDNLLFVLENLENSEWDPISKRVVCQWLY